MTNELTLPSIDDLDALLDAVHEAGYTDAEIVGMDMHGRYTDRASVIIRGDRAVKIWWDSTDPHNEGWCYAIVIPDEYGRPYPEDSGPLDSIDEIASMLPDPEPTLYLWVPEDGEAGEDYDDMVDDAQEWLDYHEPAGIEVLVEGVRPGTAPGVYEQRPSGDLQILGCTYPVPERVEALLRKAWEHATARIAERGEEVA